MSSIPTNPDALLTRRQLSAALKELGISIAHTTLATKATRGNGPPFHKFGSSALYRWSEVQEWVEARLSGPHKSTSGGRSPEEAAKAARPTAGRRRSEPRVKASRRRHKMHAQAAQPQPTAE
jgi:hypothetical protein